MLLHFDSGKCLSQSTKQAVEGHMLRRCTGIGRLETAIGASHIAHPYRVGIVPAAMGTGLVERSSRLHSAVDTHHEVIAYVGKSTLTGMPAPDFGSRHIAPGWRGATVNHHKVDVAAASEVKGIDCGLDALASFLTDIVFHLFHLH